MGGVDSDGEEEVSIGRNITRLGAVTAIAAATACCGHHATSGVRLEPITVDDLQRRLAHPQAPVTLVHVWASWCAPCREEFPVVVKVQRTLAGPKLDVLLVSTDDPKRSDEVRKYLAGQKALSSYVIDNPNEAFIQTLSTNWSGALPASFFFGPSGQLLQSWEGAAPYERYAEAARGRE